MGIVAAIVIWVTQKGTSRYTAFQALQAVLYQLVGLALFLVSFCCWLGLYFVSLIPLFAAEQGGTGEPPLIFLASLLVMAVPFAFMGIWTLGGLWGAVRCLQGREFRYPLIGGRQERWLASN